MNEIKCPCDLNQFLLGEPIFENTFPEEECKQRKFYGDCYHCFSTAIASRDHQIKKSLDNITNEIDNLLSSPNANSATYRLAIKDCLNVIKNVESEDKE